MTTSRLKLYNAALQIVGARSLHPSTGLTENQETRYNLDLAWDRGAINYCLEQGQWNFACRTVRIDWDPAVVPEYGYTRAFTKPDDWRNTQAVCADEDFKQPLLDVVDEAGYWYAYLDQIFVKYTSSDAAFGADYAKWTESFREYVEFYLAGKIAKQVGRLSEAELDALMHPRTGLIAKALVRAKNKDAQSDSTRFSPEGGWNRSRRGGLVNRRDGGNTGSLIG